MAKNQLAVCIYPSPFHLCPLSFSRELSFLNFELFPSFEMKIPAA
jgi:hypothetical protein